MNKTIIAQELIKVARLLSGTDFPTDQALKKYLKDHPDADRRKHKVVKKSPDKSDKADRTTKALEGGLKQWVKDYITARKAGNVRGAKDLKKVIDREIKEKNLDSKRVYFHFGDPDKLKKESSMNKTIIAQELIKVARLLSGTDFPTDQALKKYLKDHPDADRRKHKVVKKSPTKKPSDKPPINLERSRAFWKIVKTVK